jgi:hypothetical protein
MAVRNGNISVSINDTEITMLSTEQLGSLPYRGFTDPLVFA